MVSRFPTPRTGTRYTLKAGPQGAEEMSAQLCERGLSLGSEPHGAHTVLPEPQASSQ